MVIPLKLLLDMVPSSSEDASRAMRGHPKRLPGNENEKRDEMSGNMATKRRSLGGIILGIKGLYREFTLLP